MVRHDQSCTVCGVSPVVARGWCSRHYGRWKQHGDPLAVGHHEKSIFSPGTIEHFNENIEEQTGPLSTPCFVWKKAKTAGGYGVIGARPKLIYAHRFAFETWVGPLVDEHYICHRCDNPPCCNPEHLFIGLPIANHMDMFDKGRARRYTKISDEDVLYIRSLELTSSVIEQLATRFEVNAAYIKGIHNQTRRKNVC